MVIPPVPKLLDNRSRHGVAGITRFGQNAHNAANDYAIGVLGHIHPNIRVSAVQFGCVNSDQVQVVGIAKTTALYYFNPGFELVEIA